MVRRDRWRKLARFAAVALLAGVGVASWWWLHDRTAGRVFRLGYELSPPGQLLDTNNLPAGPVPEAIREAARRRGIQLEWVFAPEGPDKRSPQSVSTFGR